MRLKRNIILFFLFFVFFFLRDAKLVNACSCGELCTNCTTTTFTSSSWFECTNSSGQTGSIIISCQDNAGSAGNYSAGDVYWNPEGSPNTVCTNTCDYSSVVIENTVTECYDYIGTCDLTPTQAPNNNDPTNNPTSSPTSAPTPGTVIISGSTNIDNNAALSGSYCNQTVNSAVSIAGASIYAINNVGLYEGDYGLGSFSINTQYSGSDYTVTLDLSGQTEGNDYVCSCPAAVNPNNPYLCRYSSSTSPGSNVNFYIRPWTLSSASWLQVFGGNVFGRTRVNNSIPYNFCSVDAACQATFLAPQAGSANQLSSGFAITNTGDRNKVTSSDSTTAYHSYFHLPARTNNVNAYAVSTDMSSLSYDYFYNIAESSAQKIGNGQDLEPLLSDWTGTAWWSPTGINYVRVNGNVSIDETQGFNLSSTQNLVVFVDGNLTIDDSNTNDANRKITSVANGGFLAFFVSGNILITPNVGYELNPLVPTVPTVSNANSNVEGVFIADGNLTIQTKLATGEVPPDKKFIGAGTFVGWTSVVTPRTFNDNNFGPILNNNQAIDNFVYRPDLLANWPTKLKDSISNWREVDPQLVNQQ